MTSRRSRTSHSRPIVQRLVASRPAPTCSSSLNPTSSASCRWTRASTSWRRRSRRSRAATRCCRCGRSCSFRTRRTSSRPCRAIVAVNGEGVFGAKVITVFPGNHGTAFDSHQGAVLLFDTENGSLAAVLDATRDHDDPHGRRLRRRDACCWRARTRRRSRSSAPAFRRTRTSRRCAPCGRFARCACGAATPDNARALADGARREFGLDATRRRRQRRRGGARRRHRLHDHVGATSPCCSASGCRPARTSTPIGASQATRARARLGDRRSIAPVRRSARVGAQGAGRHSRSAARRRDRPRPHRRRDRRAADRSRRGPPRRRARSRCSSRSAWRSKISRRRRTSTPRRCATGAGVRVELGGARRCGALSRRRSTTFAPRAIASRRRVTRTPLVRLNVDAPAEIYLKLESLQPIGSFKLRGATNAIAIAAAARRCRRASTRRAPATWRRASRGARARSAFRARS